MRRRPCEWCGYNGPDKHTTIDCRVRMKAELRRLQAKSLGDYLYGTVPIAAKWGIVEEERLGGGQ